MEDCTRVVLYGTFDGAAFPTDNFLQIAVRLDGGERVEIPSECVMSADKIVKKDEIKLKDVIKRIEKFDLGTKAVWVNGILNELGSSYGLHKYYEGYKQGEIEGAMEREKVQVPQFVADWIEYCKFTHVDLQHALIVGDVYFYNYANQKDFSKLKEFLETENNQETFARAWLDGYTVEKEKRYRVKAKGVYHHSSVLKLDSITGRWFFGSEKYMCGSLGKHTRKKLEDAGFGEVFNSPMFEVEEAE